MKNRLYIIEVPARLRNGQRLSKDILVNAIEVEEVLKPLTKKINRLYNISGKMYCGLAEFPKKKARRKS